MTTTPHIVGMATDARSDDEVHSGQMRIARRLADQYRDKLLYPHGIGWHQWDGKRWALDDTRAATRAVIAVLRRAIAGSLGDKQLNSDIRKCESANGVAGVLALAAAMPEFAVAVSDLDPDPYLLNTADGTLDLRTGEQRQHDPADRITKVTRAAYDPQAPGHIWTAFLERVLPDEAVRAYVQRVIGVALAGRVIEHVLPIFTGTGANGKSVFCTSVLWSLGQYASTAEPNLFMHRDGAHPTGEMDLLGRRLIAVSESERDRRFAEAAMKRLTGGDTIRARRMRQDFIEFEPSHTTLLITNHLPRVSGDDPAVWRRLRVVPFTVQIPADERDPHLGEALQAEADAILAWAVAGWQEYQRRGLDEPQAVLGATDTYQTDSDAVARFIAECCTTSSPVLKATTAHLFDEFQRWRETDGAEPISRKAFGQALDVKGYPSAAPSNGKRWRHGIALTTQVDGGTDG